MYRHQFVANQPAKHAGICGFVLLEVSLSLLLLGALLIMAHLVVPGYIEYLMSKDLITRAADDYDPRSESVADLRIWLAKLPNNNQVYDTRLDDIEVYRERGVISIDVNYEKRFPVLWMLAGVMKFEDLIVETASTGRT